MVDVDMVSEVPVSQGLMISEEDLDRAMNVLWQRGKLWRDDVNDKAFYDIVYECFEEVSDFFHHWRIRVLRFDDYNIICLDRTPDASFSLISRTALLRNRSVMLIILASRIWRNADMTQPVTVSRDELYREFYMYMPKDGNTKKSDSVFNVAVEYCVKNGFMRPVPDDLNMFLLLPYIKCRVTVDELSRYIESLETYSVSLHEDGSDDDDVDSDKEDISEGSLL